jgi:cytochrome P450
MLSEDEKQRGIISKSVIPSATELVLASMETSSSFMTSAIYHTLSNPDSLSKVSSELRCSFKQSTQVNSTSTENLEYLNACMKESLRILPPVAGTLTRRVPEGGAVVRNKYVSGSTIVGVPRWAIYHSERNFTGPNEFRPEGGLRILSGLMLVTTERHSILSAMG